MKNTKTTKALEADLKTADQIEKLAELLLARHEDTTGKTPTPAQRLIVKKAQGLVILIDKMSDAQDDDERTMVNDVAVGLMNDITEIATDELNAAGATQENEVTVEFKKTKTHHKWIYRFKGEVLRTSERPDPFPFAFNYPCKDGSFSEWTFGQRPDSSQRKYNGEPKTYAVQGDINE